VFGRADAIVALSEYERTYLQRLFVKHSDKIHVVPNGLPADVFFPPTRSERPPAKGPYKILYVGQLIPLKGVDVLLRAVRRVGESHDVELLLVYHNAPLEDYCRGLTQELGLDGRVHFLGIKSGHELAELYRSVQMHVLPSFTESLPGVISEAMMSGLPVVATAVGGVPEQVGKHGRLVAPGHVDDLAAAIERTLDDIADGKVNPQEISAYAHNRFGAEAMVDGHLALYEALAGSGSIPNRYRLPYRPINAVARLALTLIGEQAKGRGWLEG
jgi:glycosyltransferase involved in cell wall biosynthesis